MNLCKSLGINAFNFDTMEHNPHTGKRLEKALRREGVNFKHLSGRIVVHGKRGVDRNTIYNWFKDEKLSMEKVAAVVAQVPMIKDDFPELDVNASVMEQQADYLATPKDTPNECLKYVEEFRLQRDHWRSQYEAMLKRCLELQDRIIELQA
jgi:hypothetical protein